MEFEEYDIKQPPQPSYIKRPLLVGEIRSLFQPFRLLMNYRKLTKEKIGNGQKIILFPGWKSKETSMSIMRRYLNTLGYDVEYWGLGVNQGKVEEYKDTLVARLNKNSNYSKVHLIGWSLGGVVAREIARELPNQVVSVITYGTPVIGGPKYTIGASFWDEEETERIIALISKLDATQPIVVPISIIFTKQDSVVSWPACLDKNSKNVTHYEVNSTHLSLGIDPEVLSIVAHHLEEHA